MKTMSVEELDAEVEKLNGLFPESFGWRPVLARKEHQDEHGVKIEPGQWYYQREGGAFDFHPVRYSATSMERLILTLFADNPILREVSQKIRAKRMAEYCRATDGVVV